MNTATFHSRKGTVASTQIDGAFVTGPGGARLHIQVNSRREIGIDHDRVEMVVGLAGKGGPRGKRGNAGGPRAVSTQPPPQSAINQHALKTLATKHTKPLSLGDKFRPSAATTTLRDMVKAGRTAEAWKKYRSELRNSRRLAPTGGFTRRSLSRGNNGEKSTWPTQKQRNLWSKFRSTLRGSSIATRMRKK